MNYDSSMIYTMGMALSRAMENHTEVDVLVDSHWLSGMVVVNDGYGVVLDAGDEHSIIKVDSIASVRIKTAAPVRGHLTDGEPAGDTFSEGAMPMPGPQRIPEPV